MKHLSNNALLASLVSLGMAMSLSFPALSFAEDFDINSTSGTTTPEKGCGHHHHHCCHKKRIFATGVCVGQSLAQQGIMLPAPKPGQSPTVDVSTKTAIKNAAKDCQEKLKGVDFDSESVPGDLPDNELD